MPGQGRAEEDRLQEQGIHGSSSEFSSALSASSSPASEALLSSLASSPCRTAVTSFTPMPIAYAHVSFLVSLIPVKPPVRAACMAFQASLGKPLAREVAGNPELCLVDLPEPVAQAFLQQLC